MTASRTSDISSLVLTFGAEDEASPSRPYLSSETVSGRVVVVTDRPDVKIQKMTLTILGTTTVKWTVSGGKEGRGGGGLILVTIISGLGEERDGREEGEQGQCRQLLLTHHPARERAEKYARGYDGNGGNFSNILVIIK